MRGKVLSYMPAFQPYRGKPAVRNDREGRGNVGIIRSPIRASTLPDCGGRSAMSVPTAMLSMPLSRILLYLLTAAFGTVLSLCNLMSAAGVVSRVSPVQTALRNCTRDEGGPFEFGNQVLISSH